MELANLALAAVLSFLVLFLIAKLVGHKQISQLDFFDYITGISIGSIAAEMATELEAPWKPLVAMLIYGLISILMGFASMRYPRTRKYLNGVPTIMLDNGKLYRENMKKAKLDLSEFMVMCRQLGYFDLSTIQTAVFEYTGKLSILPISTARPVLPEDIELKPEQDYIFTEIIMDGRILHKNIKTMGFDLTWLSQKLEEQGYHSAQEIFLAVCDRNQKVTCYPLGD